VVSGTGPSIRVDGNRLFIRDGPQETPPLFFDAGRSLPKTPACYRLVHSAAAPRFCSGRASVYRRPAAVIGEERAIMALIEVRGDHEDPEASAKSVPWRCRSRHLTKSDEKQVGSI
jgi:hypothetical protein